MPPRSYMITIVALAVLVGASIPLTLGFSVIVWYWLFYAAACTLAVGGAVMVAVGLGAPIWIGGALAAPAIVWAANHVSSFVTLPSLAVFAVFSLLTELAMVASATGALRLIEIVQRSRGILLGRVWPDRRIRAAGRHSSDDLRPRLDLHRKRRLPFGCVLPVHPIGLGEIRGLRWRIDPDRRAAPRRTLDGGGRQSGLRFPALRPPPPRVLAGIARTGRRRGVLVATRRHASRRSGRLAHRSRPPRDADLATLIERVGGYACLRRSAALAAPRARGIAGVTVTRIGLRPLSGITRITGITGTPY